MNERVRSIHHFETGKLPTMVAIAISLQDIDIRVEGFLEFIALIREHVCVSTSDSIFGKGATEGQVRDVASLRNQPPLISRQQLYSCIPGIIQCADSQCPFSQAVRKVFWPTRSSMA